MKTSRWTGLDRVVELESGKRACGYRNVTNTLSILDSHFPRMPVLPGVLMLGSMGALAAHLLQDHTGHEWRLAGAEQVRFRHFVQPGDQLDFIAAQLIGKPADWRKLADFNGIDDPRRLEPGVVLLIPPEV